MDQVPRLGMWVNEGAWEDQVNVAPEPCPALFDRWDVARQWGTVPIVSANGRLKWELPLAVDLMDDPRRVEQDGTIR
jgi:hypothetical protein